MSSLIIETAAPDSISMTTALLAITSSFTMGGEDDCLNECILTEILVIGPLHSCVPPPAIDLVPLTTFAPSAPSSDTPLLYVPFYLNYGMFHS